MNDNEINDKTSLQALAKNDFFFTNIAHIEQPIETSIDVVSKSQQCSINEGNSSSKREIVLHSIKKPKLNDQMYSLPIIKLTPKMTENILFRALHPDKPLNKANLINFNTNPKLFKSFSNPTVFKNKLKPKPLTILPTEEVIETVKFPKIDEPKVMDISKHPIIKEDIKYIKAQKVNEIYKRSNYFNKVVLFNNIAKNAYKNYKTENNSILKTYNNENDCIFGNKEYGNNDVTQVKAPKMTDVLKLKRQVIKQMEKDEIRMKKLVQKKFQQDLAQIRSVRSSYNNHKMEVGSYKEAITEKKERKSKTIDGHRKSKMTPSYVRDLKIIEAFSKIQDPSLVDYFNSKINES